MCNETLISLVYVKQNLDVFKSNTIIPLDDQPYHPPVIGLVDEGENTLLHLLDCEEEVATGYDDDD